MTTSQSDPALLREQAEKIAKHLKLAARGQVPELKPAMTKPELKIGIAMDDKTITLNLTWKFIRTASEEELAVLIEQQMHGRAN